MRREDDRGIEAGEGEDALRPATGDWDRLVRLFERASPFSMSHWNPRTGETFSLPKGSQQRRREAAEAFEARLWADQDWLEVPFQESDAAFRMARAFADALEPGRGRNEVRQALESDKPFRALRQVLSKRPGIERRWNKVVREEAEERLAGFALGMGLRLDHPDFETAALRLEERLAAEEDEGFDELDGFEDLDEADLTFAPPADEPGVRRPAGALSIGRRRPEPS